MSKINENDEGTSSRTKKMGSFVSQDSAISISVVVVLIGLAVWITRTNTETELNAKSMAGDVISLKEEFKESQIQAKISLGIFEKRLESQDKKIEKLTETVNDLAKNVSNKRPS